MCTLTKNLLFVQRKARGEEISSKNAETSNMTIILITPKFYLRVKLFHWKRQKKFTKAN